MPKKKKTGTVVLGWVAEFQKFQDSQYKAGFRDGFAEAKKKMSEVECPDVSGTQGWENDVEGKPAKVKRTWKKAAKKTARKGKKAATPVQKSRRNPWAGISPEERAARIAKIRAGQEKRWAKVRQGDDTPDVATNDGPTPASGGVDP